MKKFLAVLSALTLTALCVPFAGCSEEGGEVITLRVSSWEEYIDLGGWDEAIDLDSGDIIGVNSMVDDFTEWFNQTHDYKVKVEYSTFGTNEDLYNRLSLGDKYDLVCPSEYMLMKLIAEGNCVDYTDAFWNKSNEENYYANKVSGYIDGEDDSVFKNIRFKDNEGKYVDLHKKAACYMWGTLGLVYNPEKLDDISDVASWSMLKNEKYARQVTIKDNVRDAYFATLGIINADKLEGATHAELSALMNATDSETIELAEDMLKNIKNNVYSFETDSGKADMVTGKVIANEQWSGDAVYIMDSADEDGTELWYSVPEECTNIWFDGWLKLKNGIDWTRQRHEVAEAFVNFLSRPENAIRNMNYIGYTSSIADEKVFEYMEWNYGADEDADPEDIFNYDLSYFFGDGASLTVDKENFEFEEDGTINRGRQLFAQYPPANVKERGVVMLDFGDKLSEINQMWINVRCPDLKDVSPAVWGVVGSIAGVSAIAVCLYVFRYKLFVNYRPKKGYEKVEK
ncbi:MAG: extracellular solute-binding protein [Clostridia bacterium]|nr:extracellular solute-binding protein [Clostridia bacterium]